jgi:MSHA biogenesis protein MshP
MDHSEARDRCAQRGFSTITAIFLVVVLAALGVFIVSVTGLQQSSETMDLQGVRAYQAARGGVEWGAFQVLDPNNTINSGSCAAPDMPACPGPGGTTHLPAGTMAGSLAGFTVTVTCSRSTTTEGNRNVWVYEIVSTACNQPIGAGPGCPNTGTPAAGYVERRLTATLSKCKDSTAATPRCSCG